MHPSITDNTLGRIGDLADHAAADTDRWPAVVDAMARAFNANGAVLFTPTPDATRSLAATAGNTRDCLGDYAEHWVHEDPWIQRMGPGRFDAAGAAELGRRLLPVEDLRATRFFGDFVRHHDLEGMMSLKVCDHRDALAPVTHLTLFRPPKVDDFADNDRHALAALWPRLQRAVHAYWLLHEAQGVERIAAGTLDAMAHPAFVLRADAQIDFSNAAAQRAMANHPGIVTACGRLLRVGEVHATELTGPRPPRFAPIAVEGRLRRAQLFVAPIADSAACASAWPLAHCLLTLVLPEAEHPAAVQSWLNALGRHHGLTGAEVRVLGLLAGGQDAAAMAASLGVSLATVRTHIRALFDKTGVRRQAELVRLALAG